jgi:hypothetical protein
MALRTVMLAIFAFFIYLAYRQINRSLYASDFDYLNPTSWLDTGLVQWGTVLLFTAVAYGRGWVESRPQSPLIPERAGDDDAIRRRRDSKRFNERLKLASSALNTGGTSSLVAGFIVPSLNGSPTGTHATYVFVGVAALCYVSAQLVIGSWKTEE